MRAVRWIASGTAVVEEVADPRPQPGTAIVRVAFSGMCATDYAIVAGKLSLARPPLILGHQMAGVVEVVGDPHDRGLSPLEPGARVVVDSVLPCGVCRFCRKGQPSFCLAYREMGINVDGGFCDRVCVPLANLYRLPDNLSLESGAMVEPFACVFGAVVSAHVKPGDSVLVIGDGSAGFFFVEILRQLGVAHLSVVIKHPERRPLFSAKADRVMLREEFQTDSVRNDVLKDGGYDAVFDAVGSRESFLWAVEAVAPGGTVTEYGLAEPQLAPLATEQLVLKGITIRGHVNAPYLWESALGFLQHNPVDLLAPVAETILPSQAPSRLMGGKGPGGLLIDWRRRDE